ncbi:Dihydrofolate reductase type 3 [Anatilimnocola aggregata]|uniref:Dihydrofolate reductase n=1 Tax=Anatilimnocola aggregata TaxID=2528021 RepID=A0A517YN14_9BACT|nr:dihydrofolate reductase [Anatilimnocola aggregata]QDU31620.1 Dihydrofolate reductase type 3 [Anatilimnocola aggregata]
MPRLSLLVAVARNGVIGNRGELPWRLSADLKRFKQLTLGQTVLMGRKTYESIVAALGKPLPGRVSLVLSRQAEPVSVEATLPSVAIDGAGQVLLVRDVAAALSLAREQSELFVVGGGEIYALTLPQADRLYWTWVEAEPAGDTSFPRVEWNEWKLQQETRYTADARNQYDTTFAIYERAPT